MRGCLGVCVLVELFSDLFMNSCHNVVCCFVSHVFVCLFLGMFDWLFVVWFVCLFVFSGFVCLVLFLVGFVSCSFG